MEPCPARARERLWWSLALSVLAHGLALLLELAPPAPTFGPDGSLELSEQPARRRLEASLAPPRSAARRPPPTAQAPSRPQPVPPKPRLAAPGGERRPAAPPAIAPDAERMQRERQDTRPPVRGQDLAARALAAARDFRNLPPGNGEDFQTQPRAEGKRVDPLSLDLYFDAFIRKLNRSAAFVNNDPRARGSKKALVLITLNADGTLKEYRVLRAGDQAAEIAYVRSVVDRAAPFSAFPPDIREAHASLSILMCVYAANAGGGSGFSRSFDDRDCRD